jgi:hypothetical protein
MCLECGSRLALDYQRPPSWRLPTAIIGVVLLLAGLGVAIALAGSTGSDTSATTAAAAPAATQPAAQPAAQSPPGDAPPTASQPTSTPATSSTATPAASASGASAAAPATATGTTATPAPATATGWPPGKSGFTVVLASMPSKAAADDKLKAAQAAGITSAAILHSDDFPTLKPGYWVVFDGQYDAVGQAQTQAATDRGKGGFTDAYPRFVSKDPNAKP